LQKTGRKDWDLVIKTSLTSLFKMCRSIKDDMLNASFSRIILISSIDDQKGQFGKTNSSAAAAEDIGFTKSLSLETVSIGNTLNVIAPDYITTEMVMAVPKKILNVSIIPQIPVRRLGQAREIARYVVLFAPNETAFITKSTITANGGQYLM